MPRTSVKPTAKQAVEKVKRVEEKTKEDIVLEQNKEPEYETIKISEDTQNTKNDNDECTHEFYDSIQYVKNIKMGVAEYGNINTCKKCGEVWKD